MPHATIWFNKGFSSTFNAIETIRAAQDGPEFRILCSHTNAAFAAARLSDLFEVEPRGLGEEEYTDYCLDVVRRHAVDVFFPAKMAGPIIRRRHRFEALGARLVAAADADTLRLVEDKAALYASLGPDFVRLPDYKVVNDLAGFDCAYAELRQRHETVCFKPAVSLFGLGFRIVTESGSSLDRLLRGELMRISLEETRRCLSERPHFPDLMVMQYLPGPERSVDCLARDGVLISCVVRLKSLQEGQFLEENSEIEETVRRLTGRLNLGGLFNIQFRDRDKVAHLLEINPRMSGGLHYACLSGVAFPYWAARLAMGTATPEDIPRPRTGVRVGQVERAVYL